MMMNYMMMMKGDLARIDVEPRIIEGVAFSLFLSIPNPKKEISGIARILILT